MFHFQVSIMGTRLLVLYVICQTVITESLGGVTLPFADIKGRVTPVIPKPSSPATISSSSLICDSKDKISKLFSSAPGTQEFSSPLAFTTLSRALPVPKIDSLSIADVKLPEKFREKVLSSKLCNVPLRNVKLDIGTPDVSLPYKYPFLISSTKPSNALPSRSSLDMFSSSENKLSSLANIKSLPTVPVKPFKSSDKNVPYVVSKNNAVLLQPNITPLSRSSLDSSLTLEARKPVLTEQFNANTFSPVTSCSSPYALYYKSMFLPGVKTPSESPLNFRPIKTASNIDFPSQSVSRNSLSPKTSAFDCSLNFLPGRYDPYLATKPMNTIQLPKTHSNVPVSIKPVFSSQNAAAQTLWPALEANPGSASVSFESIFKPPEFLSSPALKDCTNKQMLSSSTPSYSLVDKIPDYKLKPCPPLKIKPSEFKSPSNFLNSPASSFVPISPSSPIVDVLSNRVSSYDCSKNIDTPNIFPIIAACTETIEELNGLSSNCRTCVDSKNAPSFERINPSSPFAPKIPSYQHPWFSQECITNPLKYSPPIIPQEPLPSISFRSSTFSPVTRFPYKISQTPSSISYVNQSPSSAIAQSTANMLSSINDLVSNIAQNILSSYKSYIESAPQSIPTIQSNVYDQPEFILKETLPIFPSPQGSPVIKPATLPIIISPIDCISNLNLPAVDTSTLVCSDAPCISSAFEIPSNQPLFISSPQPTAAVLIPTASITSLSPQICPSYLPSPTLPSYPTISSPVYMEAPVFKVSSSKKDSDVEKLIELMLLAEILNNDESFDWDDLDTLLAFLSVS